MDVPEVRQLSRQLYESLNAVDSEATGRSRGYKGHRGMRKGASVSARAIRTVAEDVYLVALGIRQATLLDTFSVTVRHCEQICATLSTTAGTRDVSLLRWDETGDVFVVNRPLLVAYIDGFLEDGQEGAVKIVDVRKGRLAVIGPSDRFRRLLFDLRSHLLSAMRGCGTISISTNPGSKRSNIGPLLSGFLLEYNVLYSIESDDAEASLSSFVFGTILEATTKGQEQDTDEQGWAESTLNTLSNEPLVLVRVSLNFARSNKDQAPSNKEIRAFSWPVCLQCQLDSSADVQRRLEMQVADRLRRLAGAESGTARHALARATVVVQTERVRLDRVAL